MTGGVNVCGVVVHARPEKLDAVEAALAGIPGVDVHARGEGGRIVCTCEDVPGMTASDAMSEMHRAPGVIAAALIYHEFDPDAPALEEQQP